MDPKAYWVGFNLVRGIGSVRLKGLLDFYGSLEIAWQSPVEGLRAAGLSPKLIENLRAVQSKHLLETTWQNLQKSDIQVLTWEDETYPRLLREIDQPPPVLYVRGSLAEQDNTSVAIVGTRRMTVYGRQVAEELGAFLASHGVTVVSGLARGVDRIAHEAVLKAGGRTIAVLGSGVDRIYPPEHQSLAERITRQGAVVSDYAPGTPPESINFPPRNRIISGLSLASVIVEASEESGALITANFAANQGREVFAVPSGIYAPQGKGTNRLIRDGAHPLLKFEEILDELNLGSVQDHQAARMLLPADMFEARLLEVLNREPQHVDEICAQSGLPIEQVSATLTVMELKGMVRQVGGMNFSLIRENLAGYRTDSDV
jgi:DNA processing protein